MLHNGVSRIKCRRKKIYNFIAVILAIVVVLLIVTKAFFFDFVRVKGESMKPTLNNHQLIMIKKQISHISKGMIVVMNSPENGQTIKRIIATEGDCVQIINGALLINDLYYASVLSKDIKYIIPQDHIFVLGDNINHSTDSRDWGPISKNEIIGIMVCPLGF